MLENKNQLNFQADNSGTDSSFFKLTALVLITILCIFIMELIMAGYSSLMGLDYQQTLESLDESSPTNIRNFVRTNALISQLFTFLIPSLVFSIFFYKSKWISFLSINNYPKVTNVFLGVLLIISSLPLVAFFFWLNQQIVLPASLIEMEKSTEGFISNMLLVDQQYELFYNLFIIAVIPALGEEFLFRGILQKKLVDKISNPHIAIWVVAIIFSAIHMQFQGFLPRVLLGGILGYLFFWTGNLWVPIIVHFFNNAFQIIGQYLYQQELIEINIEDTTTDVNWGMTIFSIAAVLFFCFLLWKRNLKKDKELLV